MSPYKLVFGTEATWDNHIPDVDLEPGFESWLCLAFSFIIQRQPPDVDIGSSNWVPATPAGHCRLPAPVWPALATVGNWRFSQQKEDFFYLHLYISNFKTISILKIYKYTSVFTGQHKNMLIYKVNMQMSIHFIKLLSYWM